MSDRVDNTTAGESTSSSAPKVVDWRKVATDTFSRSIAGMIVGAVAIVFSAYFIPEHRVAIACLVVAVTVLSIGVYVLSIRIKSNRLRRSLMYALVAVSFVLAGIALGRYAVPNASSAQ